MSNHPDTLALLALIGWLSDVGLLQYKPDQNMPAGGQWVLNSPNFPRVWAAGPDRLGCVRNLQSSREPARSACDKPGGVPCP